MKTLTIELDDEVFEMLQQAAVDTEASSPHSMSQLAAMFVEDFVRNDQHVVWDVEFSEVGVGHRGDFRRGDVVQGVENGTKGLVVDSVDGKVRISAQRNVKLGFVYGETLAGPNSLVLVDKAAPVEGLKVHEWSIFNRPDFGRFTPAS